LTREIDKPYDMGSRSMEHSLGVMVGAREGLWGRYVYVFHELITENDHINYKKVQ
tara:strand:- start:778 stop:942 length:165 start_codon:yes stop_codon:yes gene_type:complete